MNVKIIKKSDRPFPKPMTCKTRDGLIVLFEKPGVGMMLFYEKEELVMKYKDNIDMSKYEDFNGEIIISTEKQSVEEKELKEIFEVHSNMEKHIRIDIETYDRLRQTREKDTLLKLESFEELFGYSIIALNGHIAVTNKNKLKHVSYNLFQYLCPHE